jgi:translin
MNDKLFEEIRRELSSIEERRENILKGIRDILIYTRKIMSSIHRGDLKEAEKYIVLADSKDKELRVYANNDLYHYLIDAEAEIVESKILYAIAAKKDIPSYKELDVKIHSYLFGILDSIGEIKRMILDLLRNDKYEDTLRLFEFIEDTYSLIMPLAIYDNILPGLRRKLDQDKMIIESVREIITEESRRRMLFNKL